MAGKPKNWHKKEKRMGIAEWIITAFTLLITIGGAACTVILPILIVGGIGYFIYRRSQQGQAYRQAAATWPATSGTVLMSTVQSKRTGRSHSIYPVVVYEYSVNGQSYQSQRIKAGDQFMSIRITGEAQATDARYPVGATVTVYYNPSNPAESALER
jgi:hypothetical protein